jgi:hypothetical protein
LVRNWADGNRIRGIAMKRISAWLVAITCWAICSTCFALYEVADEGMWPESWPKELEPLRKHARTYNGPLGDHPHYVIPFTKREDFEAAWAHILSVKSKSAPVILLRSPSTFFECKAGVIIHCPPRPNEGKAMPEEQLPGDSAGRWIYTTYIELVVNGDIVDLSRLELPDGVPVEAGGNAKRDYEIEKFVIERKKHADAESKDAKRESGKQESR